MNVNELFMLNLSKDEQIKKSSTQSVPEKKRKLQAVTKEAKQKSLWKRMISKKFLCNKSLILYQQIY